MDPNFSRKNVFLYHDSPAEAPLIVATVKFIEKTCSINLSHVKAREVQYAKPLLIHVCPVVNKTDQDVNALLDSSRDGQDVMVVMVKRALERAKHKDSLSHLSDPLSTSTRNRVGAACTLFFSGKEKFKGYKNENNMAVHEMKRVVNLALERKPWSTLFPVIPDDSSFGKDQTDARPLQIVDSSAQKNDARPIEFVQSSAAQPAVQTPQVVNNNQPVQINPPPSAKQTIPQIKIIPPNKTEPVDPFKTPVPTEEAASSNPFDNDFFNPREDSNKPSSTNASVDPFMPAEEKPAEMLHFQKPKPPPTHISDPVFYFFDDTSPLEHDTVAFIQEHGKVELKPCRRQTAAVVTPLIIFSPCYTIPDADAKSVLGHSRDGDDVYMVVIEPVTSHSNKQHAYLSGSVTDKIGGYGVLSYCLDSKSYVLTDPNSEMISELREFIIDRLAAATEETTEVKERSGDVLNLEGFQELGFHESEA